MAAVSERWAIVVPVKRLAVAKTRIELDPDARMELALAMATDTIRAAADCALVEVVVAVCDDPDAVVVLRKLGAVVIPDKPDAGLNPALVHGASAVVVPADAGIAAVAADLPALRADELGALLRQAAGEALSFVADASGAGTTVFAAADRSGFRPAFGPDSRSRHLAAGAVDLTDRAGATVRRDVDTLADLADAARLGVGPATANVLGRRGLG
jgi:2-phospho-L-lactate guanylyltransferase